MTKKMLIVVLAMLVGGCTDPVRMEEANAIRRESEAQYMATATAVALEAKAADVSIAATATAIADNEVVMAATRPERIAKGKATQKWLVRFGLAYISVLLLAFCIVSIGGSVAASRKANLEARLVRIDKTTRTWPILLDTQTGILVDLETGERARLGDVQKIDHRRLVVSSQIRAVGLLAQAAEKIAKSTKDAQPGDMLPAIGQNVPMLALPPEED